MSVPSIDGVEATHKTVERELERISSVADPTKHPRWTQYMFSDFESKSVTKYLSKCNNEDILNTYFNPIYFSPSLFKPDGTCIPFARSIKYYFTDLKLVILNDKNAMHILLTRLATAYLSQYPCFKQEILYLNTPYHRSSALFNTYSFFGHYQQRALMEVSRHYLLEMDISFICDIVNKYLVSKHQDKQINVLVKFYEIMIELNENQHSDDNDNRERSIKITKQKFEEMCNLKAITSSQKKFVYDYIVNLALNMKEENIYYS